VVTVQHFYARQELKYCVSDLLIPAKVIATTTSTNTVPTRMEESQKTAIQEEKKSGRVRSLPARQQRRRTTTKKPGLPIIDKISSSETEYLSFFKLSDDIQGVLYK
jgi:hypothetical protein